MPLATGRDRIGRGAERRRGWSRRRGGRNRRQQAIDGGVGELHPAAGSHGVATHPGQRGIGGGTSGPGGGNCRRATGGSAQQTTDARCHEGRSDDNAQCPHGEAVAAIAEVLLHDVATGPRGTHATGEIAARREGADMDEDGIGRGQDGEALRRDPGIGIGRHDSEAQGSAESQQHDRDRRGTEGAQDDRPPFEVAEAHGRGGRLEDGGREGVGGGNGHGRSHRRPMKDRTNITITTRPTR